MYDHELDASITDFEGIFGLGLPYDDGFGGFEKSSWLTTAAWPCMKNAMADGLPYGKLT